MSKYISEKVIVWDQERKNKHIFIPEWVDSSLHLQYLYSNIEAFQTRLECWGGGGGTTTEKWLKYVILAMGKSNRRL